MTAQPARAAGLVLLRQSGPGPTDEIEVLLGRRHRRSRFMPNVYVFPGGRVDAADDQPSGFAEDLPVPPGAPDLSERKLAVYARAALRETFEETGLLVGQIDMIEAAQPTSGIWAAYARAGLTPAFAALDLIAHAITPTDYPIRFDTYFFAADGALAHGVLAGDGELEDIGWVPVGSAPTLPMAKVTRLILRETLSRRSGARESGDLATFNV